MNTHNPNSNASNRKHNIKSQRAGPYPEASKGFGLNCAHISHCFARVYATTPYLSSAKACTITMESDTSDHVLRFTGFRRFPFRPQARAPPLGGCLPHQRCDGEGVSGSVVSEGVCEAPTFMEWSTMVVPTYPEGGSHALQVCQHHHQVVRVGHFVGLAETQGTWCSRLLRPIRLKPSRYHSAQRAL